MRSRFVLVAMAMLLAAGQVSAAKKSQKPRKADPMRQYQLGLAHLQAGRADLAVTELEASVTGEPDNLIAIYTLGLAYYGIKEMDKAKQVFDGLLERDPLFTEAYNSLGLVYIAQGERARARESFERVLSDKRYLTPEVAQFNLGAVLLEDALFEEAASYLRLAILAKPENHEWRFRYALALEGLKQFDAARKELETAIQGKPTFEDALFHLGMVSLQLNDKDAARKYFGRVRDLAPGNEMGDRAVEQLKLMGP